MKIEMQKKKKFQVENKERKGKTWNIEYKKTFFNHLTPNDPYSGRTAPLTSKCCILYIYSTNTDMNILNMLYTLHFFLFKCSLFHNSNVFRSCIIHI